MRKDRINATINSQALVEVKKKRTPKNIKKRVCVLITLNSVILSKSA